MAVTLMLKISTAAAAAGAALAARTALKVTWRTVAGHNPPGSDTDPTVGTGEALAWAAASAAAVAVAKAAAARSVRSTLGPTEVTAAD